MPAILPNSVHIYNATAHTLTFYNDQWLEPFEVESDGPINVEVINETVSRGKGFVLVKVSYQPTVEGMIEIDRIRQKYPHVLIVASTIAAQAYGDELVAPIPYHSSRMRRNGIKLNRSNRFNVYPKKERFNNG